MKKLIGICDSVWVGSVFDGEWMGLDDVELIDIEHKQMYKNSFIRERFATFFHEGVKYTRQVTKKESWVFT